MKGNFCYHPWIGIDVSPQGEFRPCCKYKNPIADNIQDYFNSTELKKLREDFQQGNYPTGCERCWRDESAGIMSKRQIDWKYVLHETPPDLEKTLIVSFPFGNTCNLACRICSSYSSSRWSAEEKKSIRLGYQNNAKTIFQHQIFYKDKDFLSSFQDLTKDAIHFHFPGGEPIFVTDEHIRFLRNIKDKGSKSLHYTTNTTIFPSDELWNIWEEFFNIDIQMSIDGIENVFEYNRWPANWEICYKNIKQYQSYQLKYKNLQISISHSISIFTIWDLDNFILWCRKENLPDPYLGIVSSPKYYSIMNLPRDIKTEISTRLNLKESLPIVSAMQAEQFEEFDITKKYVTILDSQRNQKFNDVFKEFNQFLRI